MSLKVNAWREHRACTNMEISNFFTRSRRTAQETISVCGGCPVKWDCLNYAVTNCIEYGIWGGTTEQNRAKLIRAYVKVCGRPDPHEELVKTVND
jgi:WhiB family transcriptional regulator, redox-sensing transcriptional regulator